MNRPNDTSRRGRPTAACSECKRLKRKCDRQWPCNNCGARKVESLCHFGGEAHFASNDESRSNAQTAEKRKVEDNAMKADSAAHDVLTKATEPPDTAMALKSLGYVDSDIFQLVGRSNQETPSTWIKDKIRAASRAIPPRPYTDILIKGFFDHINYHYATLYQPHFMKSYVEWWTARSNLQQKLDIPTLAFTCLILRICANSALYLISPAIKTLELDLGESAESLSREYHEAAQLLSDAITPGQGGLAQVQQLFLSATWFKTHAEYVKAWHGLGTAIRGAEEIGMHLDSNGQDITEIEREMRRRLWCVLCNWDGYMGASFGRPPWIRPGPIVPLPNTRLDQPAENPAIPSPILIEVLQSQLFTQLSTVASMSVRTGLLAKVDIIRRWMNSFPRIFSVDNPDTIWDAEFVYLPLQRLQLYCTGYMTILLILRPFLTITRHQAETMDAIESNEAVSEEERLSLTNTAVNVSLDLMAKCRDLFVLCFPASARNFKVAFYPFDTAATLCLALYHDQDRRVLPRRMEVIAAIGCALYISNQLAGLTRIGSTTRNILSKLISIVNLNDEEKATVDEAMSAGRLKESGEGRDIPVQEPGANSSIGYYFDNTNGLWADDSNDLLSSQIDLGVLDGCWNWNETNFDFH